MDKKKTVIYALVFMVIMAASLVFSLGIEYVFKHLPRYGTEQEYSGKQSSDESSKGKVINNESVIDTNSQSTAGAELYSIDKSEVSADIRISEESIAEFYSKRDRGNDLDDRYGQLATEAEFGSDCGDIEQDRIALVRQLKGYLENTVKGGNDIRSLKFYKAGSEYFVTADVAGEEKDFHILRYGNAYDFEAVFMPE